MPSNTQMLSTISEGDKEQTNFHLEDFTADSEKSDKDYLPNDVDPWFDEVTSEVKSGDKVGLVSSSHSSLRKATSVDSTGQGIHK
jgi:hypothetical protein